MVYRRCIPFWLYSVEKVQTLTQIDPWFLVQIADLVHTESERYWIVLYRIITRRELFHLKRQGFSDRRLAQLLRTSETDVRRFSPSTSYSSRL